MPPKIKKRKREATVSARPRKVRRGAKKPGKKQLHEEPGDPESCDTFLQCKGNEQKTAAYLGFYYTTDLRFFAISWPVLKAYVHAHDFMSSEKRQEYPKRQVLEVIKLDETRISKADPAKDWDYNEEGETEERQKQMKTRHLAYHLLNLEGDVQEYRNNTLQHNKDLDAEYRTKFNALGEPQVPYEEFEIRKPPELFRYSEKESRLESINRCYALLQYLKHSVTHPHIWDGRMKSLESIREGVHVHISHVPGWMQVEEDETGLPFPPDDVSDDEVDNKPLSVRVFWYQDKMLPGHEGLEEAILNGKSRDFKIPSSDQSLSKDPRLCKSGGVFRDMIRKMFNCQELRLDIRDLELRYTSATNECGASKDLLSCEWEECKAVFASDENTDFVIKLVLYAVEDPSADILESDNLQPELEMMANDDGNAGEISQPGPEKANAYSLRGIFGSRSFAGLHGTGGAPKPRKFSKREQSLKYYGGFNVASESGRTGWQKSMLHDVARMVPPHCVKRDKPPHDFTSAEKAAATEAEYQAERLRAEDHSEPKSKKNVDYYTQQKAFSGTENRVGPPVDLCLDLLLCELEGDRYRATLFQEFTHNITFYHYQISGAVGLILKQYGEIDANKLIGSAGLDSNDPRAEKVKLAAKKLTDLQTHCVILADETGFGKTITCLLMLLMRTMPTEIMKPTLLVVPATVIGQWLTEIRGHWPCFRPILSYNDSEWEDALGLDSIPAQAMRDPEHNLPPSLNWLFDEDNLEASKAIVVTTYNTHLRRSLYRERNDCIDEGTTGQPRSAENQTRCQGKFGVLIADEAQRFKNKASATWAMLFAHRFEKVVAVTATPMFNSIKDILGFIEHFWQLVEPELEFRKTQDDWREDELPNGKQSPSMKMERFAGLERLDPRRLKLLNPKLIHRVLRSESDQHKRVAEYLGLLFDLVMIQRGHASVLPQESGKGISFKDMVPKLEWSTADVKLLPHEIQEHQVFHRLAASLYTSEFVKRSRANLIYALRQFSILSFSIIGARLNRLMEATKGDTYVRQLAHWRVQHKAGEFVHRMTRRKGEIGRIKVARDLIRYLAHGSPAIRLVCKQILEIKAVEALGKHLRGYQKLLIGESHPFNAWFLEAFLREMLIDARVFHSRLDNSDRAKLVKEFNDPESSIQCLIMTYDVGAIGLNLHEACNRVVITSIGINRAQESQLAGRILRITSKFPANVVRRMTPNSHDQFRSARQMEKASLQLAVNAKNPDISNLIVKLLNELQPEVDRCHASQEGQKLFGNAQGSGRQTSAKQPPISQAPEESSPSHEEMQIEVEVERGTGVTDRPTEEVTEPENALNQVNEDDICEEVDSNYDTEDDYEGYELSDADLESQVGEPGTSETDELRPYKACYDFAEISQPSEEEGYRLALLALPPNKTWTLQDLETEYFLHMGLRLLYNRIHGIKRLSLGKNIHIHYDNLPNRLLNRISKTLTKTETKKIQHLLKK